ncbi:hypothetical protein [Streptomyces atratus]|uniref:hypothetical protein n=1 Tax=Streptomyces atratus TaxID=1893 RepID=UPI00365F2DC7
MSVLDEAAALHICRQTLSVVTCIANHQWRSAAGVPRTPSRPPYIPVSSRVVLYSARDVETWLTERHVIPGPVA